MSLIYKLQNTDLETYNSIKNNILKKYPLHTRQVFFNTDKGLISYVDKLLAKYSSLIFSNLESNTLRKNLSNISSIASSEKDAVTMSRILLDFIANCEAVAVNGLLKALNYSIEFLSLYSSTTFGYAIPTYSLINTFINSIQYQEKYLSIADKADELIGEIKGEILFSILTAVFSYARRLFVYFYKIFVNDNRFADISYKITIPVLQNQMESLLHIFIDDFYDFFQTIMSNLNDSLFLDYYLESIDTTAYNKLMSSTFTMFSKNLSSKEESPEKINKELIKDISSISSNFIPDVTNFRNFINTLDDEGFEVDKESLPDKLFELYRRQ